MSDEIFGPGPDAMLRDLEKRLLKNKKRRETCPHANVTPDPASGIFVCRDCGMLEPDQRPTPPDAVPEKCPKCGAHRIESLHTPSLQWWNCQSFVKEDGTIKQSDFCRTRQELAAMTQRAEKAETSEPSGEAIMIMREHLACVGITAAFADDCAELAAHEIRSLRAQLKTALDREAATIERMEARCEKAEARVGELEGRELNAASKITDYSERLGEQIGMLKAENARLREAMEPYAQLPCEVRLAQKTSGPNCGRCDPCVARAAMNGAFDLAAIAQEAMSYMPSFSPYDLWKTSPPESPDWFRCERCREQTDVKERRVRDGKELCPKCAGEYDGEQKEECMSGKIVLPIGFVWCEVEENEQWALAQCDSPTDEQMPYAWILFREYKAVNPFRWETKIGDCPRGEADSLESAKLAAIEALKNELAYKETADE